MHTITSAECNSWELYYEEECDEIAKDSRDEVAKEIGLGVFPSYYWCYILYLW